VRTGYYFLSRSDKLYYVSIDGVRGKVVDIDKHVVIEFISRRPPRPREVEEFIAAMESNLPIGRLLKEMLDAIEVKVYTYEPKKAEVSKEA